MCDLPKQVGSHQITIRQINPYEAVLSFQLICIIQLLPSRKTAPATVHLWHPLSLSLFLSVFFSVCVARLLELDFSCPCCSHHSLPSPKTVSLAQRATPSLSGKHLFLFNKLCPTETRGHASFALIGWAAAGSDVTRKKRGRERERERVCV